MGNNSLETSQKVMKVLGSGFDARTTIGTTDGRRSS